MPAPEEFLVVKKVSKMRARIAAGMPDAVSVKVSVWHLCPASTAILISPLLTDWMAYSEFDQVEHTYTMSVSEPKNS